MQQKILRAKWSICFLIKGAKKSVAPEQPSSNSHVQLAVMRGRSDNIRII